MRRFLTLFILVPIAIVVITLSVANRHNVTFSLDPFGAPPTLSFAAPLFVFLFAALVLGVVFGGVATWLRQGRWRRLARLARAEADRQTMEAARLRQRIAEIPALPPTRDAAGCT
jgi:uncharacterized integral membrane protein